MTEGSAPASAFAAGLLAELLRLGVRDLVVCPGSRSQALALAAAEAERVGAARLHVRTDERSAAFFALGVARETGFPAPVIVTSGTAVANLMPAVLEAHEGRVPLLLLTADRPPELRGMRSNQATRQAGLFGGFARLALDVDVDAETVEPAGPADETGPSGLASRAMRAALGRPSGMPAGPVQLNLAFREPLSGSGDRTEEAAALAASASLRDAQDRAEDGGAGLGRASGPQGGPEAYVHSGDALTVVIAGEGAGAGAEAFAQEAGLPLLAEVVSGARYGREAIAAYATLIDDPEVGGLTERAIVFGHPTLTRQVPALLKRSDVEVIVVDPHAGSGIDSYDPGGNARIVPEARIDETYDPRGMRRWLGAWVTEDRELRERRSTVHEPDLDAARASGYRELSSYARTEVAALREPVTRELLVESVWRASWPHDRLVLASSRLVRVLDGLAPARRLEVRSNRGLAGIDGTVATALGIAASSQAAEDPARSAGVTRVILGDLALLHDAGSLLLPGSEPRPRIQLFVGNDGGGTIFDTLEVAGTAASEAFDRVMYTPQDVDLEALASAYGWEYRRADTRGDLARLLTEPVLGPTLVETRLPRSGV